MIDDVIKEEIEKKERVKRQPKISSITKAERKFILDNHDKDPEWLAQQLNRTVKWIKSQLKIALEQDITRAINEAKAEAIVALQTKEIFKNLKEQYLAEEMRIVEYHWSQLYDQFRGDMTHTEELQIFKLIEVEILISRLMKEKANLINQITLLEREIDEIHQSILLIDDRDDGDENKHKELKDQLNDKQKLLLSYKGAQQSNYIEYTKLLDNHKKILTDLKGTRDQRIKNIEDSKTTFFGWLRQMDDIEYRRAESKRIELFKKAMENEKARLSELHTYEDGQVDQPFLTPETLISNSDDDDKDNNK